MLLIDILIYYYRVDINRHYNRKELLNSADCKMEIGHERQCLPPTSY